MKGSLEGELYFGVQTWGGIGAFKHWGCFPAEDKLPAAAPTLAADYMDSSPGTLAVSLSVQ